MSRWDVSPDDMPIFDAFRHADRSPDEPALDALLDGGVVTEDLSLTAALVAALRRPADAAELAGEDAALAAFRSAQQRSGVAAPRRRLTARIGAAIAASAVSFAVAATAAYAGVLPATLQDFAHDTVGAPAAKPKAPAPSATPAGPDATGSPAYGLCTAYRNAVDHGTERQKSVAFEALADAAGGADQITAYCASVPRPAGPAGDPRTGPPSTLPTQASTHAPTGPPSSHPTGPPTSLPTPTARPTYGPTTHPTGRP